MKFSTKKMYIVTVLVENEAETLADGLQMARKAVQSTGLNVQDCKPLKPVRTQKQNAALHLYFTQLAEALNEAGYDMRQVIREGIDIPWTPYSVKEYLWRPVQKTHFGKRSTTQLETTDLDKIYDIVNRAIGERTGIHIPFPSLETLINK